MERIRTLPESQVDLLPCWCEVGEWQVEFRTRRFGLLRCAACGSYRIDPPPLLPECNAEDFYTSYYEQRGESIGWKPGEIRQSRYWAVERLVPGLDKRARTALDVGCGNGNLCEELRCAGWQNVIGVDVSRVRIETARRIYPLNQYYASTLEETDIAYGSVDLCILDNVIEHLVHPIETLQKIRSLLVPKGTLVIITPNMESGSFRLLGKRWTPELAYHAHVFLFTAKSLQYLLAKAQMKPFRLGSFHSAGE